MLVNREQNNIGANRCEYRATPYLSLTILPASNIPVRVQCYPQHNRPAVGAAKKGALNSDRRDLRGLMVFEKRADTSVSDSLGIVADWMGAMQGVGRLPDVLGGAHAADESRCRTTGPSNKSR